MLRTLPICSAALLCAMPAATQVCRTHAPSWPDPQAGAGVGTSIALHGDTLAAGGPTVDSRGAVYVWREVAGDYALEQKVAPPGTAPNWQFGRVTSVHGDRMVVGGNAAANYVWLVRRTGTTWAPPVSLLGSGSLYAAYFGHAMAVEGEWIAVGAPLAPALPPSTVRTGAVYLFRDQGGVVSEVAQLRPPTLVGPDDVGVAVALRNGLLVVGSAVGSGPGAVGSVVVYRIVNNLPVLEAELSPVAPNPGWVSVLIGAGATFGQTIATDGVRIAVGDRLAVQGAAVGRVDVFVQQGGAWVHEGAVFGAPNQCGFGERVAIEGDDLVVTQSCGDRVYHFRRVAGVWVQQWATPSHPGGIFQVRSAALQGARLALGSAVNPAPQQDAGRVAVHALGSGSMPYGTGLAGTGGIVPSLQGNGCPRHGHPYALDLGQGLGGSVAMLVAGENPLQVQLFGGSLWMGSIVATWTEWLGGAPGAAGAGTAQFPLVVPSAAAIGSSLCFQALVLDGAAPQSIAMSNGVEGVLGL